MIDESRLARRIDAHLCRYTPSDRFATAVFVLLSRDSGELTYVNAGHNAPLLFGPGSPADLDPSLLFLKFPYRSLTVAAPTRRVRSIGENCYT